MQKMKILLADAHILTRRGIKCVLSELDGFEISAEANNSDELFESILLFSPDILIIDFHIPGHFCIDDIRKVRKNHPEIKVFIISTNKAKQDVIKLFDLQISSYLLKECDEEEIIDALHAVVRGEKFFCGKVMDAVLEYGHQACPPDAECDHCKAISLSNREIEIIKLIAEGLTTKDIAKKIHLSFFTVATHRKNIFKKLQIRNSPELISYALKEGIISQQVA
ncbi:MAG: response regulator transcription factor [Bacteroidetes bacterium]|nr:MAG: response regulator transcription factor [Bacteroidota bacterium]